MKRRNASGRGDQRRLDFNAIIRRLRELADPENVSERQMEQWVAEFDYWEICDQVCMNLFESLPAAWDKIAEWAGRDEEYVKRAAFALLACLAWHDKDADDARFTDLFPVIEAGSDDERPMVRKAVSWALRNTGKRNPALNRRAVSLAERLGRSASKSARRISREAIRELTGEKIRNRLKKK